MTKLRMLLAATLAVTTAIAVAPHSPVAASATGFRPLPAPARIADTRAEGVTVDSKFAKTGVVTGGTALQLVIGGRAGVSREAAAATLNVTAVGATAPGYLTVYPCDQPRPVASNVNYTTGSVNSNGVFAALDASGKACIFSRADVHVVVDVNGWLPEGAFDPLPKPARIADTRPAPDGVTFDNANSRTGLIGARQELTLQVAGRAGIDAGARAVVLNVTVTNPGGPGYVTVYPCGQTRPTASNLNYTAGEVTANAVVATLDARGRTCLFTLAAAHLIVDVSGSLSDEAYTGLDAPQRLVDSRAGSTTVDHDVEGNGFRRAGTTLQIPVTGRADIPAEATAVALNVTAVNAANPGYLTLHPRNSPRPTASNVNFVPDDIAANSVIAAIGGNGMVCLFASADVDVIVDVAGYFVGDEPADTGTRCPLQFPIRSLWDGYPVGEYQLPPGRYVSETPASSHVWCEVNRRKERDFDHMGGNTLYGNAVSVDGRLIADVRSTERWVDFSLIWGMDTVKACEPLVPYVPPTPAPLATSFGAGFHEVGVHIAPGTYRSTRKPDGGFCVVLLLSSFDGSTGSKIDRIQSGDDDRITINVGSSVEGISVANTCNTFTRG
ncbi:MAG TPA: hypothetical protein VNQ73_21870 [Ilumatobacter sp.]|nr:hypothetical protein [Ilumatobacter sp.]